MARSLRTMLLGLLIMIFGAILGSSPAVNGLLLAAIYTRNGSSLPVPNLQDIYAQFLQFDYLVIAIIAVGLLTSIVGFFLRD